MPADQGHIVEAGPEAAMGLARYFAHISGADAIFAAQGQALQDAGDQQDRRRGNADHGGAGGAGDDQRPQAHQRHRNDHRLLAAELVGIAAHQPGADGASEKAHREDGGGLQQLCGLVALGEEYRREVERGCGIGVPVIPFDQIADRPRGDGFQPALSRVCRHVSPNARPKTGRGLFFPFGPEWWAEDCGTSLFAWRGRQAHPVRKPC